MQRGTVQQRLTNFLSAVLLQTEATSTAKSIDRFSASNRRRMTIAPIFGKKSSVPGT